MKKQITNPCEYDIVEIKWHDSSGPGTVGWFRMDDDDFEEDYGVFCFSSGYLVRESEAEVWLVNSYHTNPDHINTLGFIAIPKVAIVARNLIKKGKVKSR